MREVYQMFRGDMTPDAVLRAAGSDACGQFYAHLYVGLYFGGARAERAPREEHIKAAASDRYAAVGGYMHMVARVQLAKWAIGEG